MDYEQSYKDLLKSYTNLANYSYRQNGELYKLRREVSRLTIENEERAEIIRDILKRYNCNIENLRLTLNNIYGENVRKKV